VSLSERDLVAIIQQHRKDSLGYEDGDLSNQRAAAMDHYHGRPYGNEVDGRSAVVSRDLAEAVDWALPAIMRAFIQSGNLGEFVPVGPEDEQLAQQESDYTNQVLMKDNPGFINLHDAIKDTLLLKNGYVKHWWEESEKVTDEDYTGLSMDQIAQMMQALEAKGSKVEVKGQESKQYVIDGQPVELFDIKLQITTKCGKLVWLAVPSEEVRVSKRCRGSLQESPFTEHITKKTRSDLIEMGMPRSFVDDLSAESGTDNDQEQNARDSLADESTSTDGNSVNDRSMDLIEYCEAYLRVDYDADGIAELRKVVTCANKIPPGEKWNETITAVPMTGFVMKRVPHRHVGESLDDELSDLQEIKTVLNRQLLDNIYLVNNARTIINENINPRDMMVSTPGGIIRSKGESPVAGNAMPLVVAPVFEKILPVIDYWDKTKEIRTGIRPGSDMDPDILKETTKGAFLEHLNRASQKIEMITRLIAETGVKELVLQAHGILCRHQDQARTVQLRGKWVPINPREWKERTDLTVSVGLGTGNEEEKRQKLMMLWQLVGNLGAQGMVSPQNLYALFSDIAQTMGVEVPEKYILAPGSKEYEQHQAEKAKQPNPEVMAEQMKAQSQQQIEQMKIQSNAQLEQMRAQMQMETDRNRQEMEAQQQQAKLAMTQELEHAKAMMKMEVEREKVAMASQVQVLIARIKAEASVDAAQLNAASTLSAEQESASDGAVDAQ
jgi:hypothetical protein